MTEQLQRYIEQHSDPEGDYLHRLWRATHLHTLHGRMVSGHVEGRLLKMLVTMIRPKHILEIGTFTGYSALCMAEGLRSIDDGGIIHTFDVNDELEPFTRQWIDGSGLGNYIDFRIGDAIEQAPQLGVTFDLAFIDGDKRTYLRDGAAAAATRWLHPRRQYTMGRPCRRFGLRQRPADLGHLPLQRRHSTGPAYRKSHPSHARWPHADAQIVILWRQHGHFSTRLSNFAIK